MSTITTTNPLLKTLSMSNTCLTSSLHNPSIFTLNISNPSKPIKNPSHLCFSTLKNPIFSLKNQTFSSKIITHIAQTSEWEQEGALVEENGNWDFGEKGGESFSEPSEDAKLFVGNLSYDVDSERLAQIFEGAGVVEISEVIYNRETERSRGFGFVTMSTVEEADKAVEMFNRYELSGRLLTVNKAAPRGSRPERPPQEFGPSFRLYAGNLSWDVDNDRLEQIFSEHGEVLNARVVSDRETGRSRGFGFVTMASAAGMNDAIAALDGQMLDGRTIRVNMAEDKPRRSF